MTAPAPAGWYPDPHTGTGQRYWDGGAWTAHVAPASGGAPPAAAEEPRRARLSSGWIIAIIVGAFVLVIGVGVVAAIAIPVFLHQRSTAYDSAARADASTLGVELSKALVDAPDEQLTVGTTADGSAYVVLGAAGEVARVEASEGVVLEHAVVSPEEAWFCVQTRAVEGTAGPVHVDAWSGLADGPCP